MTPPTANHPALVIDGLKFRYPGADRWTVDVPALELAPGEQILLRGGSGSGKSTLLQLIAGLLDPVQGRVLIDRQPIHALAGARRDQFRGSRVGMIFQTFNLLHGFSAAENVMAALMFSAIPPRQHAARARELLSTLGIERPAASVDRLSVGQQQRVAVARALACNPALVLADEPTASLDPDNAAIAMDLIQSLCRQQQAALLCVSHDPAMAQRFTRTAALDQGYLRTASDPPAPPTSPAQTSAPAPAQPIAQALAR